jgi:hypothetical protein
LSQPPAYIFLLPVVWIGCWIAASIVFRLNRGKSLYPKAPADALYRENWGSGRSLDTVWGRIGGASNCLIIAVTRDHLVVTPRFPFNLMFLPEVYGLELTATRSRVHVTNRTAGLLRNRIVISIDGADATRMELKLRDREAFLAALVA